MTRKYNAGEKLKENWKERKGKSSNTGRTHFKKGNISWNKEKDMIRQKIIEDKLGCKFLRINDYD